jgi:hypothetical protein
MTDRLVGRHEGPEGRHVQGRGKETRPGGPSTFLPNDLGGRGAAPRPVWGFSRIISGRRNRRRGGDHSGGIRCCRRRPKLLRPLLGQPQGRRMVTGEDGPLCLGGPESEDGDHFLVCDPTVSPNRGRRQYRTDRWLHLRQLGENLLDLLPELHGLALLSGNVLGFGPDLLVDGPCLDQ